MSEHRNIFQMIWGTALFMMGVGLFFRIPHVMEQVVTIEYFAPAAVLIRICFYLMGLLLIGGGIKKLYAHWPVGRRAERSGEE